MKRNLMFFSFNYGNRKFLVDVPGASGGAGGSGGQPPANPGANGGTPPGGTPPVVTPDFGPFKSAEELSKGYKELQSTYTKTQQEMKAISDWKTKMEQTMGGKGGEPAFDPMAWLEKFATDPRGAILEVVQEPIGNLTREQLSTKIHNNLDKMRQDYPDFAELEPEIQKYVEAGAFSAIDPESLALVYFGIKAYKDFKAQAATKSKTRVPGVENGMGTGAGEGGLENDPAALNALSFEKIAEMAAKAK